MTERVLPKYPVYVPSKGRFENCKAAKMLDRDGVPFRIVVEPQEHDEYAARFGADRVLTLPFSNLGQGSIPARNWIKDHATDAGHERHWQLDDNISRCRRWYKGRKLPCRSGVALRVCEDFTDRYENIAVSGLNYSFWQLSAGPLPPFYLNLRVYSCSLVLNSIPHRWRGRYNEDTDLCLQVLADGWCTVLLNCFQAEKTLTMQMRGGNTDELYAGDGRLKMSRELERRWPGVVKTTRRFGRPQHRVAALWRKFDTPLRLKPGVEISDEPNEYGMRLTKVRDIKTATLQDFYDQHGDDA